MEFNKPQPGKNDPRRRSTAARRTAQSTAARRASTPVSTGGEAESVSDQPAGSSTAPSGIQSDPAGRAAQSSSATAREATAQPAGKKERPKAPKSKNGAGAWPVIAVIFALATAALAYLHFFANTTPPPPTEAEVAAVRAQMWRNGQSVDTTLLPSMGLQFTIQVGAYKDPSIKSLSYGLEDLVMFQKDSLVTLNVGRYNSLPDAQAMLESVIELGMENAFIVAYKDGNPVGLLSVQN